MLLFFFQAEDGIRDLVRSRGLGDVYKRQAPGFGAVFQLDGSDMKWVIDLNPNETRNQFRLLPGEYKEIYRSCLLYTSDAADERSSVDLGGRRIIKTKKNKKTKKNIRNRTTKDTNKSNTERPDDMNRRHQ